MNGWLYGLFALLGVLAGGLFSYLIMRKQLNQQDKIDSRQWQRNVRSEPLLKLREELAMMATKNGRVVRAAKWLNSNTGVKIGAEVKGWVDSTIKDWNSYYDTGVFEQALFRIEDKDIADKVKQLELKYKKAFIKNVGWEHLSDAEFEDFKDNVREIQSLINKRLEDL